MKIEDFYGKWILREGDLRPEEICMSWVGARCCTVKALEELQKVGFIFDSKEDADLASEITRTMAECVYNHSIYRKPINPNYKTRVYISGPISDYDLEERRNSFKIIQEHLKAQDYEPVNPMENGLSAEATTHDHMKRDIELLLTCDIIYMMRRWTHSKGCKLEFDVATAIGLPVMFEESGEIVKFK